MSVLKRPRRSRAMCVQAGSSTRKEYNMAMYSGQRSPLQVGIEFFKGTALSLRKESPVPPQAALGFFTDTSLCIGCKACEVACKQWNQLPATEPFWSGTSYDNTRQLGATTWRHVQ